MEATNVPMVKTRIVLIAAALAIAAAPGAQAKTAPRRIRSAMAVMLPVQQQYVRGAYEDAGYSYGFGAGFTQNIPTPENKTREGLLVEAIIGGDIATVNKVLDSGMDIDKVLIFLDGNSPVKVPMSAIDLSDAFGRFMCSHNFDRGCYQVSLGDGFYRHNFYGTPLMLAARLGRTKIVELLLKRGANPNIFIETKQKYDPSRFGLFPNSIRSTMYALKEAYWPLFNIVRKGKEEEMWNATLAKCDKIAKMLVKAGAMFAPADPNTQRTALYDAAETMSPFMLELALKSGEGEPPKTPDPLEEDTTGRSFVDFIVQYRSSLPDEASKAFLDRRLVRPFFETMRKHGTVLPPEAGRLLTPDNADSADDDPDFRPVKINF